MQQNEYCSSEPWTGAGFSVFVHDFKTLSSFSLESVLHLTPGYDFTISLQPVTHDRRNFSQWLGRCTNYVYNFFKPEDKDYSRMACFFSCMGQRVWDICKCLSVHPNSSLVSIGTARYLNTPVDNLKTCTYENRWCIKEQAFNYFSQTADEACPKCKVTCLETKYKIKLTSKKLSNTFLKSLNSLYNNNFTLYNKPNIIMKNLLIVSFVFEDMSLVTVSEKQEITPLDLFISIAGTLGLFLGASVITSYEILHQMLITLSLIGIKTNLYKLFKCFKNFIFSKNKDQSSKFCKKLRNVVKRKRVNPANSQVTLF